jgi:hypothetical protein
MADEGDANLIGLERRLPKGGWDRPRRRSRDEARTGLGREAGGAQRQRKEKARGDAHDEAEQASEHGHADLPRSLNEP